ncbi:hypothetical protein EON65_22395 [archaeon]|nr:MAG: hypothetical protein EON65_22395 [archaeon]
MVFVDEYGERTGISRSPFYQVPDDYCPTFADIIILLANIKRNEKKSSLPFMLLFIAMTEYARYTPQYSRIVRTFTNVTEGESLEYKLASLKLNCSPFFLPSVIKVQCDSNLETKDRDYLFSLALPLVAACRLESSSSTALIAGNSHSQFLTRVCEQLQNKVGQDVVLEVHTIPSCVFVQVAIEFSVQLDRIDFSKSLCFKDQGIRYVPSEEDMRLHDWWKINFMHL